MIEIRDLSIRFGPYRAVDGLDLTVAAGELFGFLGPNGAGKTTTIRALTGALSPSSGTIRVAGCDLPRQFRALKPKLGYIPDLDTHYEDLTGRENLRLYARLRGVDPDAVPAWLAKVELSEAADLRVKSYSRGMKKKLLIARELLHAPVALFLDEPTANLDRHSIGLVHGLLREQAAAGTTIFLTTHDMDEVDALCDRVALMRRGRLLALDTPARLVAAHAQRWCDLQVERDGRTERLSVRLEDADARAGAAALLREHAHVRIHTREPSFEQAFRELTREAAA